MRDPRVVEVAQKLADASPYGFEHMKVGPSAADYHAAVVAVKTLDEMAEYEYAMQMKDLSGDWVETDDPFIRLTRDRVIWADKASRERLVNWCKEEMGPDFRLVKRRKAGEVEDV